jgi:quercetin dioxygenase-like cupin family protein
MSTDTLERSGVIAFPETPAPSGGETGRVPATAVGRHVRRLAAVLVAAGLIVTASAGVAIVSLLLSDDTGPMARPSGERFGAHGVTVDGPGSISVVRQVYEAGFESSWHAHSGIEAVTILSGSLIVFDAECHPETYGPDRPYIGGQELHLVWNPTAGPVEMVVTYVSASGAPEVAADHLAPSCWETTRPPRTERV